MLQFLSTLSGTSYWSLHRASSINTPQLLRPSTSCQTSFMQRRRVGASCQSGSRLRRMIWSWIWICIWIWSIVESKLGQQSQCQRFSFLSAFFVRQRTNLLSCAWDSIYQGFKTVYFLLQLAITAALLFMLMLLQEDRFQWIISSSPSIGRQHLFWCWWVRNASYTCW